MLEFGRSLAAGSASAALAYALLLFGFGPIATCGLVASAALVAARGGLRPHGWLFGTALGAMVASRLLSDWGIDGIFTAATIAGVVAATLTSPSNGSARRIGTDDPDLDRGGIPIAVLAAAMALALAIGSELRETVAICGLDARSLVYGLVPPLLLAGLGAAIGAFLARRHESLRWILPLAASLAVAAFLLAFAPDTATRLGYVEVIQTPAASRRAFLFGVSLAMVVGCGAAASAAGVLLGCAAFRAARRAVSWAAPLGATAGAALAAVTPVHPAVPAALALTAGAWIAGERTPRARVGVVALAAVALALAPWRAGIPDRPRFTLTDRHALYFGDDAPPAAPTADGRPLFERDPPGWPFQSEPLPGTLELVRAAVKEGEILLIGDEAAALAARSDDRELRVGAREDALEAERLAAIVFLPSTFAARLDHFTRFRDYTSRAVARLRGDGRFVIVADLAQINLETLAAAVRAPRDAGLTTRLAIHGRYAIVFSDRSNPDAGHDAAFAKLARLPRPALLLGADDCNTLATLGVALHHPSHEYLLRGEGRARLPHGVPKQASTNLRRLLRLTRATRAVPEDTRIRLELAAAILDDDYATEDRLLRLLARSSAEDAARLVIQRSRARERIVAALLADREDEVMAFDADLRFRVGRVMRGLGNTLAAIEEFVRVIELRPHLLEAPVALAEVFLDADAKHQTRTVHGHVAYGRDMPFQLDLWLAEVEEESLRSRIEVARGVAHLRTALESESGRRDDFLRQALGRFRLAAELDPAAADATRLYGETLFHLGFAEEARTRARQAVAIAPLDPRTHALLAAVTDDPQEALRAKAEVLRLEP